jgi:FAD/FMN-containing dehydrogenase
LRQQEDHKAMVMRDEATQVAKIHGLSPQNDPRSRNPCSFEPTPVINH